MRVFLYCLILLLIFAAPVDRLDVAKLEPVEAVAIYMEDGKVALETDGGSKGYGLDAVAALEDLKQNAIRVVYLDTARYLLVEEGAEAYAEQLQCCLKQNIKTGVYNGGDVKEEAQYLDAHRESARPNANN